MISSCFLFRDGCLGAKQNQQYSCVAELELYICVKPTYFYEFCTASFPRERLNCCRYQVGSLNRPVVISELKEDTCFDV